MKEIYIKLKKFKRNLLIRVFIFLVWLFLIGISLVDFIKAYKFTLAWNLVFVLDLTNSMNVKDVFYNHHQVSRLTLAKKIIQNTSKQLDLPVWVIIFADKFNYYIPPTLDDDTLNEYVNALNTNYLNWWETNLLALSSWINNYTNQSDLLVFLSDFDWKNVNNLKIHNFSYFIGIWKSIKQPVKNADWTNLYLNWKLLMSSLNKKILTQLASKYWKSYIFDSFNSANLPEFLNNIKSYEILAKNRGIDKKLILGLLLILICL